MDSITSATSTLGGTKFKIQQSVPSGSIKKGPHAIVRSADLNDGIEIKRRFGSKPLFAFIKRDTTSNQTNIDDRDASSGHDHNSGWKTKSNRKSSSTESSSPERYRHRENKKRHSSPASTRRKSPGRSTGNERPNYNRDKNVYSSKTDKNKRREKSKSRSPSPLKKKPVEKLPYYRDAQREKDRLRRLYGYSRSRSPPPSLRKSSPVGKRRVETPTRRRRSPSRDRHHRKSSPYRSSRRDYRSRRSRTRSRTRSPQTRERRTHSSRGVDKERKEDSTSLTNPVISATPQYIPIPVAVPADYAAYPFPGWPTPQPPWHPSQRPPPGPQFAPLPMWPMMSTIRPPHQQTPFAGMPPVLPYAPMTAKYRPHVSQRYPPPRHATSNYQSRPKKPSS